MENRVRAPDQNSQHDDEFSREPDLEYDAVTAQRDYEIQQRNKLKRDTLAEMFSDPVERMQYCMRLYAQQNDGKNLEMSPDENGEEEEMQVRREACLDAARPKKKTPASGIIDTLKGKRGPLAWLLGAAAVPLAGAAIFTAFTFGSPVAIGAYAAYALGCAVCSHMVGYENPNRKQEYMQKLRRGGMYGLAIGQFVAKKLFRGVKKAAEAGLFLGVMAAGVLVAGGIAGAVAGPAVGAGVIIALGSFGAFTSLVYLLSPGAPEEPPQQQAPQRPQQGYSDVGQRTSMSQDYNNAATNDKSNSDAERRQQLDDDSRRLQRNEFLGSNGQSGAPTF